MYVLKFRALSGRATFNVAVAAVYWSAFTGFERDFGILATLGAYRGEHLPWGPVAITAISVAIGLPGLAACWTALGLVSKAFGLEEFLFLSAEGEASPTVGTLESLVLKIHRMTSSLFLVGYELVIQHLSKSGVTYQ